MITSTELNTIRVNSIITNAIETSRDTKLEKAKYNKSIADAIIFCETIINDALIESAKNVNTNISFSNYFVINIDDSGNHYLNPIKKDGIKYADGSSSYDVDTTIRYDLYTLEKYLHEHNIYISIEDTYYFHYGSGGIDCKRFTFFAKSV